ncbi:MAG: ParB/RepB/Spo0J family partition protein [Alphaproteobacteria bacterium]|nr:ParB/RepB/Spo0J family partition protein [Alphaproteobacteria bacterium]
MQLQHIPLDRLHVSALNMRHGRRAPDIADILPSVRARGILQPLLVRPNADGFEIVAGRRRYFAAKAVAAENGGEALLPCAVMDESDDAAALEASLIENVARLDPGEMTQHDTFVRLIKQGKTVAEIAATFGLSELAVKRRLALGHLLPKIKEAYRREEIDAETVQQLTLATKAQQQSWLKLFEDDEAEVPYGQSLKRWLFGGASIATTAALFPLDDYKCKIVADLFGEDAYFADAQAFWDLQNRAIAVKRDTYLANGWREVVILEPGERFHEWEHEKVSKKKGGHVFVTVSARGEVETFEGYLPAKKARQVQAESGRDVGEEAVAAARPEVSAALQNYIDLHRHSAVRQALIGVPDVALRLVIATALCGSPLWQVRAEPQTAKATAIGESLAASPAQDAFLRRRAEIVTLLGLDDEDAALVQGGGEGAAARVFATLLKLPNADVMRVLAVLAADTLAAGGALVEAVGAQLKVDVAASWQADQAFFDLVREKSVVNAMLAEVAGKAVADGNVAEKLKTQKQIVRDCLDGANGPAQVAAWLPGWLAFPPRGYTARGGLSHVAAWTEIADLFPQS